jgi:hypothetical protein
LISISDIFCYTLKYRARSPKELRKMNRYFTKCPLCAGSGRVGFYDEDKDEEITGPCGECEENELPKRGIIPTEEGREVLEFLKRAGIFKEER